MKTFILITKIMNGTVVNKVEIHGVKANTFEAAKLYVKSTQFYKERGMSPHEDKEGFYFQARQDDPKLFVFCQLNVIELGYL
jgi:hypothetical protein